MGKSEQTWRTISTSKKLNCWRQWTLRKTNRKSKRRTSWPNWRRHTRQLRSAISKSIRSTKGLIIWLKRSSKVSWSSTSWMSTFDKGSEIFWTQRPNSLITKQIWKRIMRFCICRATCLSAWRTRWTSLRQCLRMMMPMTPCKSRSRSSSWSRLSNTK